MQNRHPCSQGLAPWVTSLPALGYLYMIRHDESTVRRLPPPGTDAALLGPAFLAEPLPGEAEVLRARLGVTQTTHTAFLTEHIFPG